MGSKSLACVPSEISIPICCRLTCRFEKERESFYIVYGNIIVFYWVGFSYKRF